MPISAVLALLLLPIVRQFPLASFAHAFSVLALPLRLRKFALEIFAVATEAHVGRHVLLLHGLPVHSLPAQDSQQQFRPFKIALSEQIQVEGSENQQIFHLLDSCEGHVARHGAGAGPYLHVHNCSDQCLALSGVGGPRESWCRAGELLSKNMCTFACPAGGRPAGLAVSGGCPLTLQVYC